MTKWPLITILFTLIFVIDFIPYKGNCKEEILEGFSPMAICTGDKSIDEFLSEFQLGKVNKIIIKNVILAGDTPKEKITLATIENKEKVEWIISAIYKVQCYDELVLGYCSTELWLYENNKICFKLALNVQATDAIVKFYRPEHVPYKHADLGDGTFFIIDKKLCSWLLELKNVNRDDV